MGKVFEISATFLILTSCPNAKVLTLEIFSFWFVSHILLVDCIHSYFISLGFWQLDDNTKQSVVISKKNEMNYLISWIYYKQFLRKILFIRFKVHIYYLKKLVSTKMSKYNLTRTLQIIINDLFRFVTLWYL